MNLLLHLIEKNEIDIYDIPIAMITEQFLEHMDYIRHTKDMASISEFVVMAATLMEIKSRMLLPAVPNPAGEEEPDPREELVKRLTEYMKYKAITTVFSEKELVGERYVFRPPDASALARAQTDKTYDLDVAFEGISLERLFEICRETLSRREIAPKGPEPSSAIPVAEVYTVETQARHVLALLDKTPSISFSDLFNSAASRLEVIITFIAVLELARQQRILVRQDGIFSEIIVTRRDS